MPKSNINYHYYTIQSLCHTLGTDCCALRMIEAIQKKRNVGEYTGAGSVSRQEANDALTLAKRIRDDVTTWLKEEHPELMPD